MIFFFLPTLLLPVFSSFWKFLLKDCF